MAEPRRGGRPLELPLGAGPTAAVDATFLEGGAIAVVEVEEGRTHLRLFTPEGRPDGEMDLPPARMAMLAGAGPGRALVSLRNFGRDDSRLAVVETAARRVAAMEEGLAFTDEPHHSPTPGSPTVLLRTPSGLVRYDVTTRERTVLWAGPPSP
jgi:hypothetical protein